MRLGSRTYISLGLVSIVSSALVAASLLGLIPDRLGAERDGRLRLAESVAASATALMTGEDTRRLESVLRFVQKRNPDLQSMGLRRADGSLLLAVGDHARQWQVADGTEAGGDAQVRVPVWASTERWGQLELRFTPLSHSGLQGVLELPWLRLALLLAVLCFLAFHVYLARVLRSLDPSAAIPGRVRAALDTLAEGLLVIDPRGNVVLANAAFAGLLGMDAERLTGSAAAAMPWRDTAGNPVAQRDLPWTPCLADGTASSDRQLRLADRDGEERTFVVNCSPVLGVRGKPGGVLASFEDITQLEANRLALETAKSEAEAANRAKSAFLANMSHEIRTPMNAILGFTELLRRGYGKGARDSAKYLDTIQASGRHLLALINDILDLSKVEAGKLEIERAPCAPHAIVRQALRELAVKAREKGLALDCKVEGALPESVSTDAARLRQIVLNLLSNAVKFTESGGVTVHLACESRGGDGTYRIEVRDTGIGVAPERLESMFDPFTQADVSITRRFGGTGLGLTISRDFARAMGGDIVAASTPGEGSRFTVTFATGDLAGARLLDSAEVLADAPAEEGATRPRWRMPASRVLVVDDGTENRELVSLVLAELGLWVEEAENGQVALDKARDQTFDLILMDMQMPVLDGFGATRELRRRGVTTPIVALTANAMKGFEAEVLAAGCTAYVTKPIDIDLLTERIAGLIGGERLETTDSSAHPATPAPAAAANALPAPAATAPAQPASMTTTGDPIVSRLASMKRVVPTIRRFVGRLAEQMAAAQAAAERLDFAEVARIAHWLAGAAGTVGYDSFTVPARDLEREARNADPDATALALHLLADMAARVVAPPEPASPA